MIWPYSGLFGLYDFQNGKQWRHMNFYFQLTLKSPKKYENLDFSTSGLCLAFKNFFGLFFNFPDLQMSWIFQIIQIWIILKQFCHQIILAEKFANRISVNGKRGCQKNALTSFFMDGPVPSAISSFSNVYHAGGTFWNQV